MSDRELLEIEMTPAYREARRRLNDLGTYCDAHGINMLALLRMPQEDVPTDVHESFMVAAHCLRCSVTTYASLSRNFEKYVAKHIAEFGHGGNQ